MYPELLHLYGPFSIYTFGVMIGVGLLLFSIGILMDARRKKLLTSDQFFNILIVGFIVALAGGRLLYVITNWHSQESYAEAVSIWLGGFSLLGAVVSLVLIMPWYIKKQQISLLPFLDLVCTYAPLLQSVSRIGCFFAGCCYGSATDLAMGLVCKYPIEEKLAGIPLHPAQLYSAGLLFLIFIFLYTIAHRMQLKPGILTCLYLILMSLERFMVDFWRGDREFSAYISLFSITQLIALGIMLSALGMLIGLWHMRKKGQ